MTKASDDEVIARLNARERAQMRVATIGLGLVVALVLVHAGFFFTGHVALLQSQTFEIVVAVAVVGGFLVAFFRIARDWDPAINAADPAIMRKRIDIHHRHWRWMILGWLLVSLNFIVEFVDTALPRATIPAFRPFVLVFCILVTFVIVLFAWLTTNGPGGFNPGMHAILNDEFVCILRARTMRLGYAVMMVAGATALLTGIWRPALVLPALAWALWAGLAIPAFYYIVADWRASRDR